MCCAYSTAKLLFLTILLLVEASLGRYIPFSFPGGHVGIRWDIMNETRGSYSANVTISDHLKYHDIEGPWALSWECTEDEILLSTVGVTATQLGNKSSVGDNNWPLNSSMPPRREKVVPKCCEDDLTPLWFRTADPARSSSSFQITVGRVGLENYSPEYLEFTAPRSNFTCFPLMMPLNKIPTRGYLKTLSTVCLPQDDNKEEL